MGSCKGAYQQCCELKAAPKQRALSIRECPFQVAERAAVYRATARRKSRPCAPAREGWTQRRDTAEGRGREKVRKAKKHQWMRAWRYMATDVAGWITGASPDSLVMSAHKGQDQIMIVRKRMISQTQGQQHGFALPGHKHVLGYHHMECLEPHDLISPWDHSLFDIDA